MNSLQLVREVGRLAVLRQGVSGMMDTQAERISLRVHRLDYENLVEEVAAVWEHGAPHWSEPLERDRELNAWIPPWARRPTNLRKLADR